MNRFAMLFAAQLLVGMALCQSNVLQPLPKRGLPEIGKQPLSLYWLSKKDGSVWRSSLDGTRKELVIDCKVKGRSSVSITGSRPGKGSNLALTSIPDAGYTILDVPTGPVPGKSAIVVQRAAEASGRFVAAPYSYSNASSPWRMKATEKSFRVADHTHQDIGRIEIEVKGKSPSYSFRTEGGLIMAILESGAIILKDGDQVILWTLPDDRKYLFADAYSSAVWTRDLSKSARYTPVAKVVTRTATYTYKLKSPVDIKRPVSAMTKTSERRPYRDLGWQVHRRN